MQGKMRIGEVLVEAGYITQAQLNEAIHIQQQDKSKRLGEVLLDLNYIVEENLLAALSKKMNLQIVDLKTSAISVDAVALVPKALCLKDKIVPISMERGKVVLAVNDPLDLYAIEDVRSMISLPSEIVLAKQDDIIEAINRYYGEIDAQKASTFAANTHIDFALGQEEEVTDDKNAPIINLVNSIVYKAYVDGASDIHFEPFEKHIAIRMRIDGQLVDYLTLKSNLAPLIATRIKILAALDIAEKRVPQDGHFKITTEGKEINTRVSVMPTVYGEKLVLRFLNNDVRPDHADTYGMNGENYRKIKKILNKPYGIIYITGPTGSGKTTTLYMMIEELARQNVNICTIEDPVERTLPRVNQVQVNNLAGMTFERGLRSMLRQDPDVILVGETRDSETAQTSVNAAITGHLVFSTLHTNDAVSTIARLHNMGVEHYLIASSLIGVVAQRLVKKICPHCKEAYLPSGEERELVPGAERLYRGKGCPLCNGTGYKGRVAVHEILEVDAAVRSMIEMRAPTEDIYEYLRKNHRVTFIPEQIRALVTEGVTTTEELKRQLLN